MQTKLCQSGAGAGHFPRAGRARVLAVMLCAPLALVLQAGCGSSNTASTQQSGTTGEAHYMVTADSTSFYKFGPAQAEGPDLRLKKGEVVTMIDRHYGYSKVLDPDGDAGYVPTEDISPASNVPTALAQTSSKKSHGASSGPVDYDEQPNDSALPTKQPPSDQPVPSFRY